MRPSRSAAHPPAPPPAPALRHSDSTDPEYYGSAYDWLFEEEGELLGLLLALSPQAPSAATAAGDGPAPALPVYAVFASSSRAPVVPSATDADASAAPAKAKPLELIVAPLGVGAKPPRPASEGKDFDPRCACLWGWVAGWLGGWVGSAAWGRAGSFFSFPLLVTCAAEAPGPPLASFARRLMDPCPILRLNKTPPPT